jgi:GNAT superfamily N-acetyltransferase
MSLLPNAVARGRYVVTPNANLRTSLPFIQTIELLDDDKPIASATWFTTGNDGVVQLLNIRVVPEFQRKGVGTSLFKQLQREADRFMRTRNLRLRRIFCNAEQKTHIVARGFFTKLGFHHVQTLSNTLRNEDILVYLLGCD